MRTRIFSGWWRSGWRRTVSAAALLVVLSATASNSAADDTNSGTLVTSNVCALYVDPLDGRVKHEEVIFPAVLSYRYTASQTPGPASLSLLQRPVFDTTYLQLHPFQDGFCRVKNVCVVLTVDSPLEGIIDIQLNPPVRGREELLYRYTTPIVPGPALVDPPDRHILTVLGFPSGPVSFMALFLGFSPIPPDKVCRTI